MSDLVDFLLARIAEDEAVARAATGGPWTWDGYAVSQVTHCESEGKGITRAQYGDVDIDQSDAEHIARYNPARVLAECEAKRRIVQVHTEPEDCEFSSEPCSTLRLLALPYADRADFLPEWKAD